MIHINHRRFRVPADKLYVNGRRVDMVNVRRRGEDGLKRVYPDYNGVGRGILYVSEHADIDVDEFRTASDKSGFKYERLPAIASWNDWAFSSHDVGTSASGYDSTYWVSQDSGILSLPIEYDVDVDFVCDGSDRSCFIIFPRLTNLRPRGTASSDDAHCYRADHFISDHSLRGDVYDHAVHFEVRRFPPNPYFSNKHNDITYLNSQLIYHFRLKETKLGKYWGIGGAYMGEYENGADPDYGTWRGGELTGPMAKDFAVFEEGVPRTMVAYPANWDNALDPLHDYYEGSTK